MTVDGENRVAEFSRYRNPVTMQMSYLCGLFLSNIYVYQTENRVRIKWNC